MALTSKNREMLSKLIGMLGTDNEHERANAASFLKRKMDAEKISFGEIAEIIGGGGAHIVERVVYRDRPQQAYERPEFSDRTSPNPATEVANTILRMSGSRLSWHEMVFLKNIVHKDGLTGGNYDLTAWEADKLIRLRDQFRAKPQAPFMKATPKRSRKPVPNDVLDELGLTDSPQSGKGKSKPGGNFDQEV